MFSASQEQNWMLHIKINGILSKLNLLIPSFPSNFYLDLLFQQIQEPEEPNENPWWTWDAKEEDGSICFFDQSLLQEAKALSIQGQMV